MAARVVSDIAHIEVIASGSSLRERYRLCAAYGGRRWRKLKGVARVELADGRTPLAEIHWFEAHGIGRKEIKLKRILEWGERR